jgi:hypothetical protein
VKNNTSVVKSLLNQALQNTSDDFSLQEAKAHIRRALGAIESVEQKRNVREQHRIERKNKEIKNPATNVNFVLNVIEKELAIEKAKLEEIKSRRNAPKIKDQDDENGMEYVMG